MKPIVYIFRGAPASGKGTVISEFCKMLPRPIAFISQDVFRWNFHLIGRSVPEITNDDHILANKNAEMVFEQYLKNGKYTIVIEGLYTWNDEHSAQGSAHMLTELAKKYGFRVVNVFLQADKEVLLTRNEYRTYSVPLAEFNTLYDNIYKSIDRSEIIIDSTNMSIEATIDALATIILPTITSVQ